jgi:hypothetical protein
VAKASSPVSSVRTTSTSFIAGTGLKKCRPSTRSGRRVAAASWVMVSDDVLLAISAGADSRASRATKVCRFSSRCSTIASITRSQPASWSRATAPLSRALAASRSAAVSLPFSTARSSDWRMRCSPFCSRSSETSRTIVS